MTKGQKYIIVDSYSHELLQEIIKQGKASDLVSAIGKSAAAYLGITYKSKEERRLEQEAAHVMELGRIVTKEE